MNYLLIIQTFIQAIHAVEQLMPDSKGKDKLDAAMAIVESVVGDISAQKPALMAVATLVVNTLRTLGVFRSKP